MNTEAMEIPRAKLAAAFLARVRRREEEVAARDERLGKGRAQIGSYMENLGWPPLLGFDMNDYFRDDELSVELLLRERIFWADNSADDWPVSMDFPADVGMYWDLTLFGQRITHERDGVPQFAPHPVARDPDVGLLTRFEFGRTGVMPGLLRRWRRMGEIVRGEFGEAASVSFPHFHRGPLDILVQMRGYEGFAEDTLERPAAVDDFLAFIAGERLRFARERARFLGIDGLPPTTAVADDWVNVPFLSPAAFRRFVAPVYRGIRASEGPVTYFHTCGRFEPIVNDILGAFPEMKRIEVSGWNDLAVLHEAVPRDIAFDVSFINTFVLAGTPEEHRARLELLARIGREREIACSVQAIVNLLGSYEKTLARMNAFIDLARDILRDTRPR